MGAFRFVHSSDLHLGRGFAAMPQDIRHRLTEARHGAISRLAGAARAAGAAHVLVAGDIFDSETPSDAVWRQALTAMAADPAIEWLLLPGNHDSLAAEALWERLVRAAPPNVRALVAAEPIELALGAVLLPAPTPRRRPGRDPTEWMDEAVTPEGALRIGLAHGPVQDFGEGTERDVIAPDRAARAGLAYLALGDWHGAVEIDRRTWYSGAPERDRFRHAGRGLCLSVALEGAGAPPVVHQVETGIFDWREAETPLLPGEPPTPALEAHFPPPAERRNALLKLRATGRTSLSARAALIEAAEAAAPEFGFFALDDAALEIEVEPEDLDEIDRGGALRTAAEALRAEAETGDEEARAVARAALSLLHTILRREAA